MDGRVGALQSSDQRSQRSRTAVLEATVQLLAEAGLAGATIEGIAARSRVAKTTIYRHWAAREDLVIDACRSLGALPLPARGGALRADLIEMLMGLAAGLQHARWAKVLAALVDGAERSAALAGLHAELIEERQRPLRALLEQGRTTGELPAGVDIDVAVAALAGSLFYRRYISHETIPADFVERLVGIVLEPHMK